MSAAGCPAGQSCGTADRGQVAYNGGSTSGNAAIPACVPPRRSDPICGFNPAVTTAAGTLTATGSTLTGDLSVVGTLAGLAPACKGHRLRISAVARVTNDNDKMAGCTVAPGSTCTANGTSSACHNPNYGCKAANSPATCCTGNGSGSCPLDNSKCTGAALPFWCCTGAGNGTCGADSSDPCLNQVCGANSVHKGAPCCSGNTTGACGHGGTTIDLTPLFLSILNIPVECRVSSSGACNLNTSVNRAVVSSHCTGRGTADGGNATCCTNAGSGNCTQALCTGTGTPFGCCTGAGNTTTNGCNILSKGNRVGFELKDLGLTRVSGNNVNDFCAGAGKTETGNATCCTGTHAGTCTGAANCVASNNPFQCCTGNGTGPDCQQPTNEANYYCTGSGTPAACCTGVGTGTCTAANCTGSRVPFDCCIAASSGCGQPDYNTQKSFGTGIFDP